MYIQHCLLMSSERRQRSSGNHSCLCSMTTKKKVWRWSLPLIDDDSDGDLKFISMCHRPWHEGWSVERSCLWAIVSQRKVWVSPLPMIYDGDDVVFGDSCRDENISKPFWWTLLAYIKSRMGAFGKWWSLFYATDGSRVLDSKYLLDGQPPDASECLLQYLEIMRMLFCANPADCSAVESCIFREFHSSI